MDHATHADGTGPLVLLVDGDRHGRQRHADFLIASGLRVAEADGAVEALAKAFQALPKVLAQSRATRLQARRARERARTW